MRLTKLIKAVVLSAAALALAVPASTGAQPSQRARQQFAHQWTHQGHGVTGGPLFYVDGDADVHWQLGWFCPAGSGYGLHVNREVYGGSGIMTFFPSWHYVAKVYSHDGADGQTHIVSGVEGIRYSSGSDPWRFTFHAASECYYEMIAEWN